MSIRLNGPRPTDHFAIVPNAFLRDPLLRNSAKGLMSLILSHSPGYVLTVRNLSRQSADGEDAIKADLERLRERGYLHRERSRNDDGTLGEMNYIVHAQALGEGGGEAMDDSETKRGKSPLGTSTYRGKTSTGFPYVGESLPIEEQVLEEDSEKTNPPVLATLGHPPEGELVTINSELDFERFWKHYPRKTDKDAARKAWKKAVVRAHGSGAILSAVERLALWPHLPEKQFQAHPATWLNRSRWLDVLEEAYPPRPGSRATLDEVLAVIAERESAHAN